MVESFKSSSSSRFNSKNFLCTSFANLWELVKAKLQDVVPEQPTAEAIVNDPVFARPFSINLEYMDFRSSS